MRTAMSLSHPKTSWLTRQNKARSQRGPVSNPSQLIWLMTSTTRGSWCKKSLSTTKSIFRISHSPREPEKKGPSTKTYKSSVKTSQSLTAKPSHQINRLTIKNLLGDHRNRHELELNALLKNSPSIWRTHLRSWRATKSGRQALIRERSDRPLTIGHCLALQSRPISVTSRLATLLCSVSDTFNLNNTIKW